MSYFEPACEYHNLAPDATFTDWVFVTIVTDRGHEVFTLESFVETVGAEEQKRPVSRREWTSLLERVHPVSDRVTALDSSQLPGLHRVSRE